jgi:hypothetical protein
LDNEKLQAALVAAKIPVNDMTLGTLGTCLDTLRRHYPLHRAIGVAKSDIQLRDELERLCGALETAISVLEDDLAGTCQIEVLLTNSWRGSHIRLLLDELQTLRASVASVHQVSQRHGTPQTRSQTPETEIFLRLHSLFAELIEAEPGIAGPLHRFTVHCAALIDPDIVVPPEGSWRRRLCAALKRDSGKAEKSKRNLE